MEKPVKPIKPSKKSPAPSETILQEYSVNYFDENHLSYSLLTKIKEELGVDDLFLDKDDYDYGRIRIYYRIVNPTYLKDLEAYNNRFDQYEVDLKKYNEDVVVYKKFALEQSKKRLEAQIRKLSKLS